MCEQSLTDNHAHPFLNITSTLMDLSTWPKEFKYAYAHLHIYKSKPTHRSCEHTRSHTPACTQSLFPFFCLYAEAEPVRPWCHWWGHCLGHQQHTDVPLRTTGNYEVMDQHTHTPPYTHTHTYTPHLFAAPAGSWVILQSSPSAGAAAAWENSHHVPAARSTSECLDGVSGEKSPHATAGTPLQLILENKKVTDLHI